MVPTREHGSVATPRRVALPLLAMAGPFALSAARLTLGTPLDGVALALHLVGVMAGLRLIHPLREALAAPQDAAGELVTAARAAGRAGAEALAAGDGASERATPSERFDSFAAGSSASPGAFALPAGRAWLWSGPYAGVAFTLVLGLHTLFVPLLQVPLTFVLLPAPCLPLLVWWWRGRALRSARRGVALLLTPTLLVVRDALGARSASWGDVQALRIESQAAWDMLRGARRAPRLMIARRASEPLWIRQDELGVPVDAALAAIEAYREGVLGAGAASPTGPSAGS